MKATHIRCVGPKPDYSKNPRRTGTPPVWHVYAADNYGMAVSRTYTNGQLGLALLLMRRIARDKRMPHKVFHPDCPAKARGDCFACPLELYGTQCRKIKP